MEMITVSAKTEDEATIKAALELQTTRDKLEYEVIDKGSTGFLGIGARPVIIRAKKKMSLEDVAMDFLSQIFETMNIPVDLNASYNEEERELSINMGGVFNMCKAAVAELKKQEGSTIVTVGSDLGVRPIPARIGYCPSKAGVIMLTKCIALEYAPSIRANAILPGLVRTPMIEQRFTEAEDPAALEEAYASLYPLHKMGKVEDMANAAAFLSSDESGFMTGEIMHVCGGSLI